MISLCAEKPPQVVGAPPLAGDTGATSWIRRSIGFALPLERFDRHRARRGRRGAPMLSASSSASDPIAVMSLRPVDERQTLSFAPSAHARDARRAQRAPARLPRAPARSDISFADEREREVGEGREIAACADRSLRWDARHEVRARSMRDQRPRRSAAGRRTDPLARTLARRSIIARVVVPGERDSDAAGVAAHEIQLKRRRDRPEAIRTSADGRSPY